MFRLFQHEKRLRALEERQDEFSKQMKGLQLEWDETYDKVRTLFARIAKRQQREAGEATPETAGDPGIPGTMTHSQLVQQQILARRRRMNGGGS